MADFPKTLFKAGGDEVFWGRPCSRLIVYTEEEEAEALQDGWQVTAPGAPPPIDPGARSTRARGAAKKAKP